MPNNTNFLNIFFVGKENTVLRAKVAAHRVSVIPNAVDTAQFIPNPSIRPLDGTSKYLNGFNGITPLFS